MTEEEYLRRTDNLRIIQTALYEYADRERDRAMNSTREGEAERLEGEAETATELADSTDLARFIMRY